MPIPRSPSPENCIEEATILAQEAAEALRHYLDGLEVDPGRQEEIERRAAALEALARKHRQGVLELPAQTTRIEQEVQALDNAESTLAQLETRLSALAGEYRAAAERLTAARTRAADGARRANYRAHANAGHVGWTFCRERRGGSDRIRAARPR